MESPALGLSLLGLLAIVVLILTNAYFVATEFALVAVRRTQVELWVEEGRRGAASAARAIRHLDGAIAATQLGITLASIGLGFIGEPALAPFGTISVERAILRITPSTVEPISALRCGAPLPSRPNTTRSAPAGILSSRTST